MGGIKDTQGHSDRHQWAFGEGTTEAEEWSEWEEITFPRDRQRTQPGCSGLGVTTELPGSFRKRLSAVCLCSLWGSTIMQMSRFLWMGTMGLHSQEGYSLTSSPLGTHAVPKRLPTAPQPATADKPVSDLCSKHTLTPSRAAAKAPKQEWKQCSLLASSSQICMCRLCFPDV